MSVINGGKKKIFWKELRTKNGKFRNVTIIYMWVTNVKV